MRNFDFSPLFRSTIGFDHLSQLLDNSVTNGEAAASYPPYNIEKVGEDKYQLTIAVAGFTEAEIDVTVTGASLVVKGRAGNQPEERTYLHRGIAGRTFERRFELADHLQVVDAGLENGLLNIDLVRELPEALKPRTIAVGAGSKRLGKAA